MKDKKKKTIVVATITLVVVVIFLGVAYAAVGNYTGNAVNTTNTSPSTTIKLTIGGDDASDYTTGAFSNSVYFNTANDGTMTYTLTPGQAETVDGVENLVLLGQLVLHVDVSDTNDTYVVKISDNGIASTQVSGDYFIKIDSAAPVAYAEGNGNAGYTVASTTGDKDLTISLYIKSTSLVDLANDWVMNGVTFTFLATATPVA